jgi:acyl-CoA synthetase (AMP-forming)/AMP-acid ligase II
LRQGDTDDKPGSVGTMNDNCELRIVDVVTGQDLPAGSDGEIWLRSPQMTVGYWNRPAETAHAITADGWFRTGDIGMVDEDGYLYIRDRLKDMIISGGENIYSVEVENAILSHPDVLEAAVYGLPHEHWGETVKAVVVTRDGHELTAGDLMNHLAGRLASYKRPRIVEFVAELPKTGSGKILKQALRDHERG